MKSTFISLLLILIIIPGTYSKPTFAPCFTDGMVLQRDMPVKLWGNANPGEEIKLSFQQKKYTARADNEGNWMITTSALATGGPFTLAATSKEGKHEIAEVYVGEVWIAGGQSNMEWSLSRSTDGQQAVSSAKNKNIRFLYVPRPDRVKTPEDNELRWKPAIRGNVGMMSAVAYYFAANIQPEINVPIGIICCYRGGSSAEAWISDADLQAHPQFNSIFKPKKANKTEGDTPPGRQNLHQDMLSRVLPYTVRGTIWYQGEANAARAQHYKTLFPYLIETWRKQFDQPDMPFYFVQLPKFGLKGAKNDNWAQLREAQLETLKSTPNTGMAVILDCGEENQLHPTNKKPVGERLARIALAKNYGKNIAYSGPLFKEASVSGNKITLSFDYAESGLNAAGDPEVKGFEVSADGTNFLKANATLGDKTIILHSEEVKKPVAVRYGWSNNTDANLYNNDGLMASPFRTEAK